VPQCDRKDFMSMKNSLTPAGIEPATFRFAAQHLNHCATAVPRAFQYITHLRTLFPSLEITSKLRTVTMLAAEVLALLRCSMAYVKEWYSSSGNGKISASSPYSRPSCVATSTKPIPLTNFPVTPIFLSTSQH